MNSVRAANESRASDNVLAESLMVCPIYKKNNFFELSFQENLPLFC